MDKFAENVSKHFGQPWTGLIQHCRKVIKDKPPDKLDGITKKISASPTTKLLKEDAGTFGLRPALDECLLTVCNKCEAVIKPQALLSHIEKRHSKTNDGKSIQHLLTEKPIIKGLTLKSKLKNSPKSSPKRTGAGNTNLLEKYKLPNRPINRTASGKFAPGLVEKSNSALAKHLSSTSTQPVVALDDVSPKLTNVSSNIRDNESQDNLPLISKSSSVNISTHAAKSFNCKRSLDSNLTDFTKSEPAKKARMHNSPLANQYGVTIDNDTQETFKVAPSPIKLESSSQEMIQSEIDNSAYSQSEPDNTFIYDEKTKPPSVKVHQLTTYDKSIPCKDREYDPDRHCGCWLDESWGKHCTRSLTCKSHALSLRRKVEGRSKPFDVLLQEHREAKEALQLNKLKAKSKPTAASSGKAKRQSIDKSSLAESEVDKVDTARTQTDYLGYSSFHPRPLAAPSYNARLCGNAYVPNRQTDILRMAFKCAIEQPKHSKKSSAKSVKSMVSRPGKEGISASLSNPLLHYKSQSNKLKHGSDKRKGAKKLGVDSDPSSTLSPPYSHKLASSFNVTLPHSQSKVLSADSSVLSVSSPPVEVGSNSSTFNLLTNGATQLCHTNMLKDISTSRQKIAQPLAKSGGRNSIHLTTNASGIATLASKHLVLDSHSIPFLYSASGANDSTEQMPLLNSSDIISRAVSANGLALQGAESNTVLDNTSLVELVSQQHVPTELSPHRNTSNIQYISPDSNLNVSEAKFSQSIDQVSRQQYILPNSSNFNSHVMQATQKQPGKPNASIIVSRPPSSSLKQQQHLHHAATAHHGYS